MKGEGLLVKVAYYKYIHPLSIKEWFRDRDKSYGNVPTMWKDIILAFDLIVDWLVWSVGNGIKLRIG